MKTAALVIIKPEGLYRAIVGEVLNKFSETGLEIVSMRLVEVSRFQAEEHYKNLQGKPFFKGVIDHLMGKYHEGTKVVVIVYYGKDAIKKCRKIAGATNPEEADPQSIRGSLGRITKDGLYENVVHVSSDLEEAKREIRLWLSPDDIYANVLPTKKIKQNGTARRAWK
jgi:nucleoside-diphosphate kinase